MPWGLKRFHESGQSHFVTFCCYHRRPLLTTDESRRIFESALERVRHSYKLCVYGYVVMPEHVHLLLSEPQPDTLADALKSLKQGVSRRLIGDAELSGKSGITISTFATISNLCKSFVTSIAIPWKQGYANVLKTGSGAVFVTMPPALKDASRSSRNGRHENANERREHSAQRSNYPTQAKNRLEWATRPIAA
jgi:REP element-mobilizing transposase RayT